VGDTHSGETFSAKIKSLQQLWDEASSSSLHHITLTAHWH
jgi:hypothetical protein